MMFTLFAVPGVAENFYDTLGNQKMVFKFSSHRVDADGGEDIDALIATTDLAIALSGEDEAYEQQVERYVTMLLEKPNARSAFSEIDSYNLSVLPASMHPNFYSIEDYYVCKLYSIRLKRGETDLYVDGRYVAVADFIAGDYGSGDADIVAINQLSQYVQAGGQAFTGANRENAIAQLRQVYNRAKSRVLGGFNQNHPTIKQLFEIRSLSYFAYHASQIAPQLGSIESQVYGDCDDLSELYVLALSKYKENLQKQ